MVDEIYNQSQIRLPPEPLPAGPLMTSNEYYWSHNEIIAQQLSSGPLGELVSGHKKDVVITNRLLRNPARAAIYGWHRSDGDPIQPLSLAHPNWYAERQSRNSSGRADDGRGWHATSRGRCAQGSGTRPSAQRRRTDPANAFVHGARPEEVHRRDGRRKPSELGSLYPGRDFRIIPERVGRCRLRPRRVSFGGGRLRARRRRIGGLNASLGLQALAAPEAQVVVARGCQRP